MAPHSSTLAWKIPWTEEPGRLQSMGSLRVGHDWVTSLSLFTFMHWRRKWQPTPVFLSGEYHGQRSLVGYSPRWSDLTHISIRKAEPTLMSLEASTPSRKSRLYGTSLVAQWLRLGALQWVRVHYILHATQCGQINNGRLCKFLSLLFFKWATLGSVLYMFWSSCWIDPMLSMVITLAICP